MARSEWAKTTRLIDAAVKVLEAEHPMTVRQCFYRLVSVGVVENSVADYRRVSQVLTTARNDGRIDFSWIVDRSRSNYSTSTWNDLAEFGECVLYSYRRDNWQDQPNYVEVWTEKDAIIGSIQAVANAWAVTIRAQRGFNSTTCAHEIAVLFHNKNAAGKRIKVFYLGDWYPSGAAIEGDVEAYNISRSSWNHLEPTIRKAGSEIWVSFNPSQENDFIYQKFVANAAPPDAVVKQFNYYQNPWLSEALKVTREYMRDTDPAEYLNVYAGQCKVLGSSIVYDGRYERGVLTLPEDPVVRRREWGDFLLGVDFGQVDPSVMLKVWFNEQYHVVYIEKESWGKHIGSQELAAKFLRDIPEARNWPARCDCSRLETIAQLLPSHDRPEGIQAKPCEKWKGSIEDGISWIKSQKIMVHPSCTHVWDELGRYRYKVDRNTGDVLPELVDKDNHCLDALRYGLEPWIQRSKRAGMWAWEHLSDMPGRIC